jgi:hypothetical protein
LLAQHFEEGNVKQEFRKTVNLSPSFQRRLSSYAAMASAAGVSALALAQPAEGKIVYTRAHRIIAFGDTYKLDLNHDGITDFSLFQRSGAFKTNNYHSLWVRSNSVAAVRSHILALALPSGVPVGSGINFLHYKYGLEMVHCTSVFGHTLFCNSAQTSTKWANVTNRYLGLKFLINGEVHYGWARFNVKTKLRNKKVVITPLLTGYAYETVPDKPIITGQTQGPEDDNDFTEPNASLSMPARQTATLGMLALGAPTLSIWRRGAHR